jgi:2'-5' RNA ligase
MRLFVAVSVPEEIRRTLEEKVRPLRGRLPRGSWVKPEAQHFTLAFLGEQDAGLVDPLSARLEEAVRSVSAFQATLCGCGFFPNPRRARVGWIGISPEAPLQAVASHVREAVAAVGVTLDRADFKAHLTLVRIKEPWKSSAIETFTNALEQYESALFRIDQVTLYRSQLGSGGATHIALRTFALQGPLLGS